jgi:hypothetical protein
MLIGKYFSISIIVQPNTGIYEGFTDGGEHRHRSVVLAPVKVRVEGEDFTLMWTCNLAELQYASTPSLGARDSAYSFFSFKHP